MSRTPWPIYEMTDAEKRIVLERDKPNGPRKHAIVRRILSLRSEQFLLREEQAANSRGGRSISKRLRFEILCRDQFACQYCGHFAPQVQLHVDHIVPVTRGGTSAPSNLRTACEDCNMGKLAMELDEAAIAADKPDRMANRIRLSEIDSELEEARWEWSHADFDAKALDYYLEFVRNEPGTEAHSRAWEAYLDRLRTINA